jgi:hypothetical protein
MDIVDSIVTASAAASAASAYIREFGATETLVQPSETQKEAAYA